MVDVYLSYKSVEASGDYSILPNVVLKHCNGYKNQIKKVESLNAWLLLNELLIKITSKSLKEYNVEFSKRGKPILDGCYISLSHSNGVVVVGCSNVDFGLDIETLENAEKYMAVAKKLGAKLNDELFLKWTQIESVSKLKDMHVNYDYVDASVDSKYVTIGGKNAVISVACNEKFNIIVI